LPIINGPETNVSPHVIVSEADNSVTHYDFDFFIASQPDADFGLEFEFSFEAEAPCARGYRFRDSFFDTNGQLRPLIIGHRNAGLTVYQNDTRRAPPALLARLNDGGSYCAVAPVDRLLDEDLIVENGGDADLRRLVSGRIEGDSLVLAYEENSGTLNLFEIVQSTGELENIQTIAVDLETTNNLEFVKGIPFATGSSDGIALIFADTLREGDHRMVIAGINAEREILQVTRGWNFGTPNDILFQGSFGFLVSTSDSSDAVVFRTPQGLNLPVDEPLPFLSRRSDLPLSGALFQRIGDNVDEIFRSPFSRDFRDITTVDFDTATVTVLEQ